MNVVSVCKCIAPHRLKLPLCTVVSMGVDCFHSGFLHCIMNTFPPNNHFYLYTHAQHRHTPLTVLLLLFLIFFFAPTFTLSLSSFFSAEGKL